MVTRDWEIDFGQACVLRVVSAVSVGLGLFWAIGLIADIFYGIDIGHRTLVVLIAVAFLFFVIIPTFWLRGILAPRSPSPLPRFFLFLVATCFLGFALLIPVFALFGWLLLAISEPNAPLTAEGGQLVGLVAIWLPLWWAPSVGAFGAWWLLNRPNRGNEKVA